MKLFARMETTDFIFNPTQTKLRTPRVARDVINTKAMRIEKKYLELGV